MANTTATVVLELRNKFSEPARKVTRELGTLGRMAEKMKSSFRFAADMNQAAEGLARFGSAARQALSLPINTSMDFEDQMARVGALSDATAGQMSLLTDTARTLGRDTRYSATEAAQGMEYLAQAGFSVTQQMQAMPGLLATAAANAMDLGRTAEIAADAMNGFGLQASDMGRIGDVLTKAGAESSTNLDMIGESLKYVAPIARVAGGTIEQVSAAVALLANAGMKGSQSGTALRAMFLRLAAPTGKVKRGMAARGEDTSEVGKGRDALAFLGIDVSDKAGNMRPLNTLLKEMFEAIEKKGLGSADKLSLYKKIFGEEAATAAAELIDKAGSGMLDTFTEKMEGAVGTNERMAARMNATTKGLVAEMSGAFEDLNIELGDALGPEVRELGTWAKETATEFRVWASEHPGTVSGLGKVAIAATAIATVLGSIALVGPAAAAVLGGLKIVAFPLIAVFKGLSALMMATSVGAIAMTAPITAITLPMVALGAAVFALAYAFGSWIDGMTGASSWISNLIADITGLNDAKNKLMRGTGEGTQGYADGTVLDKGGKVLVKGTEWERHASGMGIKEWEEKKRQEAAAKAPPPVAGAAAASGEVEVKISLEDNRIGVKTKSKGRGINTSAGPAMAGAGS